MFKLSVRIRISWVLLVIILLGIVLFCFLAPVVSASTISFHSYRGTVLSAAGESKYFFENIDKDKLKQIYQDAYYYDLAVVIGLNKHRLFGIYWDESGALNYAKWENPFGVNASYIRLYPMTELTLIDYQNQEVYFSKADAEASPGFLTKTCEAINWDEWSNSTQAVTYLKYAENATWSHRSTHYKYGIFDFTSTYDAEVRYSSSWEWVDITFDSDEPIEPTNPGSSTLPTNPDFDPERPFASTQPIWIRKLDSYAFPDFPLGGQPLTLSVEASSPNGGQILYQWHITGQNVDGTIFLNETTQWGSASTYDISLEREGLYSVIAYAKNRYIDNSGASVDSLFITTSLRYIVSADGTDALPDPVVPPYDGWAEDSIVADDYKDQVSDRVEDIQDGLGIIDSVTVPNVDNIDINILDMIEGNGFNAMNTILSTFWENNIIITVLTFAFIFAMIGYFIFGKR